MNKSTLQRALLGLAVLMMLVPTFLFAAGPLRRPPMFEGDQLTKARCQPCEGLGQVKGSECEVCRGQGQIDVVIPGPHRPVQLVGTVRLREQSVGGAAIEIVYSDGAFELKTNPQGQFGAKLPPGSYTVRVAHDGRKTEKELKVEPDNAPIPVNGEGSLRKLEVDFPL